MKEYYLFRVIEPIFRIKSNIIEYANLYIDRELDTGLYCIPFSFRIPWMWPGSFKWFYNNDKFYIRYYLTFNFYGYEDFKCVQDFEVREYLFSDEEVKNEYIRFEEKLNIDKLIDPNRRILMIASNLDEYKHKPDILHILKGIDQTHDKIFDHDFKIKSWWWTEESNINISLSMNQGIFYSDEIVKIKFVLETSEKVNNFVSIQWLLIQEVTASSIENSRPKKRKEFELGMISLIFILFLLSICN